MKTYENMKIKRKTCSAWNMRTGARNRGKPVGCAPSEPRVWDPWSKLTTRRIDNKLKLPRLPCKTSNEHDNRNRALQRAVVNVWASLTNHCCLYQSLMTRHNVLPHSCLYSQKTIYLRHAWIARFLTLPRRRGLRWKYPITARSTLPRPRVLLR